MNKHTKRRKRHRANAVVKYGKSAVRKHMRKGGRTGGIWRKRTHGKHAASAGEAGTATTPQSGVVYEHATREAGDAQPSAGSNRDE